MPELENADLKKSLPEPSPAGYKSCVLGRLPMAGFEVSLNGRF
jgi:hypothetical protein